MKAPNTEKANALSLGLFLIGVAILYLAGRWWPGILLVVGIPYAIRNYIKGRLYDSLFIFVIFTLAFLVAFLQIPTEVLVPIILFIIGLHIIFREYGRDKSHHVTRRVPAKTAKRKPKKTARTRKKP